MINYFGSIQITAVWNKTFGKWFLREKMMLQKVMITLRISWFKTDIGQDFTLAVAGEDGQEQILANKVDGSFLGSETAGGFVGAYVGMFASGNGTAYEEYVSFDWFSYCSRD